MNYMRKAILFGVIAGMANIVIYLMPTRHILIFAPYIVLMFALAGWMFRRRIVPFWSRVAIALTAFAVTTFILWVFVIAKQHEQVFLLGVVAGLGKMFLIGAASSVVAALVSTRWRTELPSR